MKENKPELSPFVKRIAEHYQFEIKYYAPTKCWEVKGGFYNEVIWTSNEGVDKFLDALECHFHEAGAAESYYSYRELD